MDLSGKIKTKLTEGKHTVTLSSIENVDNAQGGYLAVVFKENGEDVNYTCFPKSLDYFMSNMKKQLGLELEDFEDIFNYLNNTVAGSDTSIDIWVDYNYIDDKGVAHRNINFHEPKVVDVTGFTEE